MGLELSQMYYRLRVRAGRSRQHGAAYAFSTAQRIVDAHSTELSGDAALRVRAELETYAARADSASELDAWASVLRFYDRATGAPSEALS